MLDYVAQLTRDATRIGPAHHKELRRVGFDDRGILQITLIASWFNYINRVAMPWAWGEVKLQSCLSNARPPSPARFVRR